MNKAGKIRTDSEGSDRASDWIAMLDRGFTEREEMQFKAWLFESDENYSVFMTMASLWDRMDALSRLADILPESPKTTYQLRRYALPIAASIAMAAFLALWGLTDLGSNEVPVNRVANEARTYETGIGGRSSFELSDGTKIVLNTNSRVKVQYTNSNRFLYLERGEIHVNVAHDSERPLSVMVGDRFVQAVGTEFNVEITDDESIELVVTEGVVMVGVVKAGIVDKVSIEPIMLKPSSALVAAGQEVVIKTDNDSTDDVQAEEIDADEIAVKLSWREGNLIFRGESLEVAISEVGRYTAVQFVFLDEESKKVRVAGLFKAGDVDGLLTALRQNFDISYEWVADNKILLSGELKPK